MRATDKTTKTAKMAAAKPGKSQRTLPLAVTERAAVKRTKTPVPQPPPKPASLKPDLVKSAAPKPAAAKPQSGAQSSVQSHTASKSAQPKVPAVIVKSAPTKSAAKAPAPVAKVAPAQTKPAPAAKVAPKSAPQPAKAVSPVKPAIAVVAPVAEKAIAPAKAALPKAAPATPAPAKAETAPKAVATEIVAPKPALPKAVVAKAVAALAAKPVPFNPLAPRHAITVAAASAKASAPAPRTSTYSLEEQIGFLLRKAHQRASQIFASTMAKYDLTPTQWAAIAKLYELGPMSQTQLARLTALDHPTLLGVIGRLNRANMVRLRPTPEDPRVSLLELTPATELLAREMEEAAAGVTTKTLSPLTPAEAKTLNALLERLG